MGKTEGGIQSGIRYPFIDGIRGLAVVNMAVYHIFWNLVYIFGLEIPWFFTETAVIWERTVCFTFILLSGFCSGLSERHSPKRGKTVLLLGLSITFISYIITPDFPNVFGILTFIGINMTAAAYGAGLLSKVRPTWGFAVSMTLFVILYNINQGTAGAFGFNINFPEYFYKNNITACLGFPHEDFVSADYFPLLPWSFLFGAGYFMCRYLFEKERTGFLHMSFPGFLRAIGRHSLEIYIVHEPLILAVLELIFIMKKG